ncbi:MAG: hypothetical protein KDB00_27565 [Planctomycetales bacterium]|nr:hypothetical protein [Planctomycetales bacterium]
MTSPELQSGKSLNVPLKVPLTGAAAAALITLGLTLQPGFLAEPTRPSTRQEADVGVTRTNEIAERVARAKFYDSTVVPLIAEVDAENHAAAERCLERIDRVLKGYHAGVELFVDEMTSISTRLGVLKRMPGGWWSQDGRVEAYVQSKFETHLFSEQKLVDDISGALLQFRADVDANQTAMLTRVQAALSRADVPGVGLEHREEFFDELSTRFGGFAADQGTASVENMLGAFVLGEVGAFAARSVVAGLLVRFVPSMAISSAAGASATVGASATGAGGGSLGGPIGTVVGFGAGLAIGLVIDWWMTEKFEAELSRQMHVYLYDLESTLISGGKGSDGAGSHGSPGLEAALPGLCGQLREAYRDRFYQQIVDGESP